MEHGYTVAQIRAAEEAAFRTRDPGALMQAAAAGLAAAVLRELRPSVYGADVLLLAGAGNNGGDALYAGARLAARGVRVRAWLTSGRAHPAALAAFRQAGGREVGADAALAKLADQRLVVDGVAGLGSRPGLPDSVARLARACAELGVPVVAVDLPSGLSPEPPWTEADHFQATLTLTFGGLKLCGLIEPARSDCGRIELVDIGLDLPEPTASRWTPAEVAASWPVPGGHSEKYQRGVVELDTGSADYPGAGVLGCMGAVHAGAGMVRFTGPAEVAALVHASLPNVVTVAGQSQALVLGSGWVTRHDGADRVARALAEGGPVVLDAGAIGHLPQGGAHSGVLLTPHPGELGKLLGVDRREVGADPIGAARRAAAATGATILLKGATGILAAPNQEREWLAVPGPGWTAQAGSGDVLAGICGALMAAGLGPVEAGLAGASVQAMAAARQPGPWPPQQMARVVSSVVADLTSQPHQA